jgi:hypothetical protein
MTKPKKHNRIILRAMTAKWRKEFQRRYNKGEAQFGDCNFNTNEQAIQCLEHFEQLGGKVEIDPAFFSSIRVLLPRDKDKAKVRERLMQYALTMTPQPTKAFMATKNRLELEWN